MTEHTEPPEYENIYYACHVWIRKFENSYWSAELWNRIHDDKGVEVWRRLIYHFAHFKGAVTLRPIMVQLQDELSNLLNVELDIKHRMKVETEVVTDEERESIGTYRKNVITAALIELWLRDSLDQIIKDILQKYEIRSNVEGE